MKKLIAVILTLITVASSLTLGAAALDEPTVENAASAYLYNIENKRAVFTYEEDKEVFPASTVKIMTGLVALETLGDKINNTVTVTKAMLADVTGNNIGLSVGETVKLTDMMGAMLVNGANDAAYVLANAACGSTTEFVRKMNSRAAELGASNTVYTNPTGIHDERMHTTARDMCTIAIAAYKTESFMDYAELLKYTIQPTNMYNATRTLYNRNCLLSLYYEKSYYYDKAKGMNAGSTYEGGYCVVTTAKEGDLTYLCVVMDADEKGGSIYSYVNAKKLLDWAFESFVYLDVLSSDQTVCELPVTLSMGIDYATLVSKDTLSVYLPTDTDIEKEIKISWTTDSEELQAPVREGQVVGRVTALYKDEPIGTTDLIATADIARSDMLYTLYKINMFSQSRLFIAALISAVVFFLVYVFGKAIILKKRKNNNYR